MSERKKLACWILIAGMFTVGLLGFMKQKPEPTSMEKAWEYLMPQDSLGVDHYLAPTSVPPPNLSVEV